MWRLIWVVDPSPGVNGEYLFAVDYLVKGRWIVTAALGNRSGPTSSSWLKPEQDRFFHIILKQKIICSNTN